ncbi:MAG: PIG-L family deacetylase [Chloroflexales bacterium]|nr:PIG-L family deacetylase [Chloroflexales bacterium]
MRITDLSYLRDIYNHVCLSPHLDDVESSCGGMMIRQRHAGERVLTVTLCTAVPPLADPFSAFAIDDHRQAHASQEVIVARLGEETLAMEQIGADHYWAGMLHAIYRFPQAYAYRATLFNTPHPDDPLFNDLEAFLSMLRARTQCSLLCTAWRWRSCRSSDRLSRCAERDEQQYNVL